MVNMASKIQLIKTAAEAERERKRLKSIWSAETQLSQRVLIRCMDLLEEIAQNTGRRRRPTVYQKFVGTYLKEGATIKEAAAAWRKQKEKKSA